MPEPSSKRRILTKTRLMIFMVLLLVTATFVTLFYLKREPSYGGKSLSEWVDSLPHCTFNWQRAEVENAIRHIGTNAIPFLLEGIKPEPQKPPLRERIEDWLEEHTPWRTHQPEKKYFRTAAAYEGFKALGPIGKPALPELKDLALYADENTSSLAMGCLVFIGPEGVSALTNAFASTNAVVRRSAIYALAALGNSAENLSPMFAQLIHDKDRSCSRMAIMALGAMHESGQPYVSTIREMLASDPDAAAVAMISLGNVVPILRLATNAEAFLRYNCTLALSLTNGANSMNPFRVALRGPISLQNTNILQNLDRRAALIFANYLSHPDAGVRAQAAANLEFIGTKALSVVGSLAHAVNDSDKSVRERAASALRAIDVQSRDGGIIRGPRKENKIALEFTGHTFAEGGETILDELEKHHAKASFFLTGDFLRNPEFQPLVQRIADKGHFIGPHSDKHLLYCSWEAPQKTLVDHQAFVADLSNNLANITRKNLGFPIASVKFWLPAYEHYNQQIVDWSGAMGLTLVNYTPGTRSNADYTQESDKNFVSSQAIFDSIVKKEREDPDGLNGFLLLMHLGAGPGRHDKMHARFGELLDYLSAKGYQFVRIDEMFGEDGGGK